MAGYQGSFLKGLAGGLQTGLSMGMQVREMRWKRDQQKKLEKDEELLQESWENLKLANPNIFASLEAGKSLTPEQEGRLWASTFGLSEQIKESVEKRTEAIKKGDRREVEEQTKWMNAFSNMISEYGSFSEEELNDYVFKDYITSESGKRYITAHNEAAKRKEEATRIQAEIPEPPPTELDKIAETEKWLDSAYATGNAAYFNRIAKERGSPATFETYKQKYEPEELEPEIKYRVTSLPTLEKYRVNALNADTLEDMQSVIKDYEEAGYDPAPLTEKANEQEWANTQIEYLSKVKRAIENLLVDRGDKGKWLNNKVLTEEEVGIKFKGERPASEIYEELYKSYTEYLEKLRKMGIDVSQFPELLPLSEIERVKGTEGFFAIGGVKKGDYKSIYK